MKRLFVFAVVVVAFFFAGFGAQAFSLKKLGEQLKQKPGASSPEAPTSPGAETPGSSAGGGAYLQHRESLVPWTGLGHQQRSDYWKRLDQALNYLRPRHDACHIQPAKKEMNNSNEKVWPSHIRKIAHCVKLLSDQDGQQACYVVELDCKEMMAGQKEPSSGEWADYDRCLASYQSTYRSQNPCPSSF